MAVIYIYIYIPVKQEGAQDSFALKSVERLQKPKCSSKSKYIDNNCYNYAFKIST